MLEKLNWCYRLWTLLTLNAIELSRRYKLTQNTVYSESYWHINSTELTLHWHYVNQKEQTALNATHNRIHTTKHLKSHHDIPHHTAISRHHFTPYALLHHTILHHFTLCSPSRPQTFHTIQHTIPHHTLQQIFCSIIEICPQDPPILLCTLLSLCVSSCVPLVSCLCVFWPHSTSKLVGLKLHFTSHYSTPHHTKRFHITSHQKILHHTTFHVTPFHITPPLHNIPRHITTYHMFHATSRRHLMSQHISPRTTIFYIRKYYTAVCLPPPFHTTTSQSTT